MGSGTKMHIQSVRSFYFDEEISEIIGNEKDEMKLSFEKYLTSNTNTSSLTNVLIVCEEQNLKSVLKFFLAKYYKDSEMTVYISERSRNSK